MKVELQVCVKDAAIRPGLANLRQRWLDGMPRTWRLPGMLVEPADVVNWMRGREPAGLDQCDPEEADSWRRRVREMAWIMDPARTLPEIARICLQLPADERSLELARQRLTHERSWSRDWLTHGIDVNWGSFDLRHFGILVVDLDPLELRRLTIEPSDRTRHPAEPFRVRLARRSHQIDYRELLSDATGDRWLDRTDRVEVPRSRAPIKDLRPVLDPVPDLGPPSPEDVGEA